MPATTPELGAWSLVVAGGALLAGFAAHVVGRRAHVPRVSLILLIGVGLGPVGLDVVPRQVHELFPVIAQVALSMVGFTLGKHFTHARLRRVGRLVLVASIAESCTVAAVVLAASLAFGCPLELALLLAAVAPATAPAASVDVIREVGAEGPLSETTLEVVALDDAWAILVFTGLAAAAAWLGGGSSDSLLLGGAYELLGGVALGAGLGLPMAWITGRIRKGELTLIEALGFVLLAGGLASLAGVSYLITCMMLGIVVANLARHHERAFHAVEGAMDPFLIVFFLLAGFALEPGAIAEISGIGGVYVAGRVVGKVAGGALGARLGGGPPVVQRYLGWTLLPQAGVALGLGLLVAHRFPDAGARILQVLIGTTVVFELFGPIATRVALARAGEIATRPARRRRSPGGGR